MGGWREGGSEKVCGLVCGSRKEWEAPEGVCVVVLRVVVAVVVVV